MTEKGKTINTYARPGQIRQCESAMLHREPHLHRTSEVDNAYGTGTRIAKNPSFKRERTALLVKPPQSKRSCLPSRQVRECWKRDIQRLRGTLKNLRMSACCYQVRRARETQTLDSRLAKSTSSQRIEVSFFACLFVLTPLGTMCHSRKQWNRDTWRWSGPFSRCLSLTPALLKSYKEVFSSLRGSFFFFLIIVFKRGTNKKYFS